MRTALVVTSIHGPNQAMKSLAAGCIERNWGFFVAGDSKSPDGFSLDGASFLSLQDQKRSGFRLGDTCPTGSYTRKNLGYLEAIRSGVSVIVETDDDNHPRDSFWTERNEHHECCQLNEPRWHNVYQHFTEDFIYPRGLPLTEARSPRCSPNPPGFVDCPIQQGLADLDPDVDAIFRILFSLPFSFQTQADPIAVRNGAWCPFNSQNTTFFKSAFPLLYLPASCSFRMTDIWRSFVALRVLEETNRAVLFHGPTVWQERNEHDLQRDFEGEVSGYLNNDRIRSELRELRFPPGASTRSMMELCYQRMIRCGWLLSHEEDLLRNWWDDLEDLGWTRSLD